MEGLVSVIITTYKRSFDTLSKAINSVLTQTYNNLELIIVDDNPEKSSHKVDIQSNLKALNDNRVNYIQHENNQGACVARNTGINNSRGNYIAFLDDDDEWLPNKLEYQIRKFSDEKVGLVYCFAYIITIKDNKQISKNVISNRVSGMVYDKLIEKNFIGSTSFVILKKEALDQCGYFNNDLKSSQDYDLWLRISKGYKVNYVDIPLVNYYIHEGERISENVDNKIQGKEKINELNIDYLKLHPIIHSKRKLTVVPFYAVKYGCKFAMKKWWEAVKIYPYHSAILKNLVKLILYSFRSI
ncbi:glycosyltransferase family 2 protein [Lentibacillus cibarius]|uniref:glycosyltransferase family 2 protein n=1 Tax=Lentibacillus cibarius TaxID=2583219 RepID=UPI0014862C9F|nr:glycosyltransferase family 2 protein [Lentibacillus cibarius]